MVITWTLQVFGPTSLTRLKSMVVTASYGGINVLAPLLPTVSTIDHVYVSYVSVFCVDHVLAQPISNG